MRRTYFKVKLDSLNTEFPFQTVWWRNNQPLFHPPNCLCNVPRLRWPKLYEQVWLVRLHSKRGPATAQEQARTQPRQPPPPHRIHVPAGVNARYVTQKEPWISINQWGVGEGRAARKKQQVADWCDVTGSPHRNELIVGPRPKPPLHFLGSEITLACPILSGLFLNSVWTLWPHPLRPRPIQPGSSAVQQKLCCHLVLSDVLLSQQQQTTDNNRSTVTGKCLINHYEWFIFQKGKDRCEIF